MTEPSIFTRIIGGEIPAHKIYEDDKVIAFLDINPITPGHTLVVPKQQIESLWDLDDELYEYIMDIVRRVARQQQEVLKPVRVGLLLDGADVPHAHIHVIPLNEGMKSAIVHHDQNPQNPDDQELAAIADQLRFS